MTGRLVELPGGRREHPVGALVGRSRPGGTERQVIKSATSSAHHAARRGVFTPVSERRYGPSTTATAGSVTGIG